MTNEFSKADIRADETSENDLTDFDDPNLEPLPSEDEKVAAKYAAMKSFDEAVGESKKNAKQIPPGIPKKQDNSSHSGQKKNVKKSNKKTNKAPKKEKKPSTTQSANTESSVKSKKWLYIGAAAVLLLGGGGAFAYTQQQQKAAAKQEAKKEQENTAAAMADLEKKIADFYTDDTQTFIKADKATNNLNSLSNEIEKYENQEGYDNLLAEYQELSNKVDVLTKVNNLFTEPVIDGGSLKENPLLKSDEAIELTVSNDDEAFTTLLNQAIEQAKTQYDGLQNAKAKVALVYGEGTVLSTANRTAYNEAVAAVANVRNQELAKGLNEELSQVDETLTEAEQAAQAAQQENDNNTENNTNSSASSNSGYFVGDGGALTGFSMNGQGNPIVNSNQSDINDSGNSAWIWADDLWMKTLCISEILSVFVIQA